MTKNNHKSVAFSESRAKTNRNAAGFSLIEVIISMIIFLVVMGAVYQVMRIALIQRNTVSTRIDAIKSARIALNYIRRDAINAGLSYHEVGGLTPVGFVNNLVGIPTDVDLDRDWLTGIISGNNVTTNTLNTTQNMDSIGFITRDLTFNSGNLISVTGTTSAGSDVTVQTGAGQTAVSNLYDLYLIEFGGTSQVVGLVTAVPSTSSFKLGFGSAADPLKVNQSASATGNNQSPLIGAGITGTLKKINLVTYSVRADGALLRKIYGNNTGQPIDQQIQTHELIYNVQDFQVSYLMDDGTISTDPTSNNNGRDNQLRMNQVIQMEITITVMPYRIGQEIPTPITIKEVISARNLRYTVN